MGSGTHRQPSPPFRADSSPRDHSGGRASPPPRTSRSSRPPSAPHASDRPGIRQQRGGGALRRARRSRGPRRAVPTRRRARAPRRPVRARWTWRGGGRAGRRPRGQDAGWPAAAGPSATARGARACARRDRRTAAPIAGGPLAQFCRHRIRLGSAARGPGRRLADARDPGRRRRRVHRPCGARLAPASGRTPRAAAPSSARVPGDVRGELRRASRPVDRTGRDAPMARRSRDPGPPPRGRERGSAPAPLPAGQRLTLTGGAVSR